MPRYPTKTRVRDTLFKLCSNCDMKDLEKELHFDRGRFSNVLQCRNYRFPTYEAVVKLCAKYFPDEDWSYVTAATLHDYLNTHHMRDFYYQQRTPSFYINTYTNICDFLEYQHIYLPREVPQICSESSQPTTNQPQPTSPTPEPTSTPSVANNGTATCKA